MSETPRSSAERHYLLGTLSSEEEIRLEEGFIADDGNFEKLELVEDELIDAYVNDELSVQERRQFETRLLTSPRIVDRVNFARALAKKAGSSLLPNEIRVEKESQVWSKPKLRWWESFFQLDPLPRTALAVSVLLVLIGGLAAFIAWRGLRNESQRLASERTTLQKQKEDLDRRVLELQGESQRLAADRQKQSDQLAEERKRIDELQRAIDIRQASTGTVAFASLFPGSVRSPGEQNELKIGPGTSEARLTLALEDNEYRSYSAVLKSAQGRVIFRKNGLRARNTPSPGSQILFRVPAGQLVTGNYVVSVSGLTPSGKVEEISDYVFRVTKK